MANVFTAWWNERLDEVRDPVSRKVLKDAEVGDRLGFSREKAKSWRTGVRVPSTPDDIAAVAKFTNRSQADVLQALGFEVQVGPLSDWEREVLTAARLLSPNLREAVPRLIRALQPPSGSQA